MCLSKGVYFKVMMKQGCRCGIKVLLEVVVPDCLKENIVNMPWFLYVPQFTFEKGRKYPIEGTKEQMPNDNI
jgi:hypothetical protein